MPPKIRISKQLIEEEALQLVREKGAHALNARTLAKRMHCSTQPIFSNYSSMEELKKEVLKKAYEEYYRYNQQEIERGRYPEYKAYGIAYIRFAKEEKELFKWVFMRDRSDETGDEYMEEYMGNIMHMLRENMGISNRDANLFHLSMWTYVHGIATMQATSYCELDWDIISNMITKAYQGLLKQYVKEE